MYIWCAIDIDEQVAKARQKVAWVCAEMGIENPTLTLPYHISLKISCEVADDRVREAKDRINAYFSAIRPFEIATEGIERQGGIVWIKHRESEELRAIHSWLVELFDRQYGVPPHEFDLSFAYHTSLYVGDEETARMIYDVVKGEPIPEELVADRFVIGCSESGKAGEYRVIKTYHIGEKL